jgi:hypothetical protein
VTNSASVARSVAAEPRVYRYPPYGYSRGDDAIEQAEDAGLYLDNWQQDVLRHALGEREDGKWSAFETGLVVGRQQGKGAILEARVLAGFLVFEEPLILWSAHEYRTALEMFRRVRTLIRRLGRRINENLYDYDGILIKVNNTNGEEGFERLDNEQRIQFIARSKNAGRGFSADCLIWDEAFALTEDQVDAQMPTLLARPNTQIWYASSPPLDAVSGAQLFRVRKRAMGNGQDGLAYFEWGAEGCLDRLEEIDLDDRAMWRRVLPAHAEDRVTEEGVQRLRDAMSDYGFAREVLCVWPPDLTAGYQVIPADDWSAAEDRNSQVQMPVALAAAVSLDRKRAAIAACGRRPDGKLHVEITSEEFPGGEVLLDNRPGGPWVVQRLIALARAHKPAAIVMDEFGPTGSLIPEAEEAGLEITRIKTGDVGRAFGMFYDAVSGADVASRNLRHLGQPELTAAVAGATKRSIGDASAWDRRNASVDITPLVAATNALWGYATRGQQVKAPFNTGVVVVGGNQ